MNTGSKILCVIYNHNRNENSKLWLDRLLDAGFDAYILDSGSDKPLENDRVIKLDNIYWGGMFDETIKLAKEKNPEWVFHVDDDILIDDENFEKLISQINIVINDNTIGIYQPSTTKESHNVWRNNVNICSNEIRDTAIVEEWMWLMKKDILIEVGKLGLNFGHDMKYGWGVGLLFCKKSMEMGYMNVVDDTVIVVHPPVQANYNTSAALSLMTNGFSKLGTNYNQLVVDCARLKSNVKKKIGHKNKIICCLLNYKNDENAVRLYNMVSTKYETYIIDTFHKENGTKFSDEYDNLNILYAKNIYWGGSIILAYKILEKQNGNFLLTIDTDIVIDEENREKFLDSLSVLEEDNNIGVYSGTLKYGSKALGLTEITLENCHLYNHGTNKLRNVHNIEGWLNAFKKEIMDDIIPYLDLKNNKYGWGISDALCRRAIKRNLRIVVDDRYEVFHPHGISYNNIEAQQEYNKFKHRFFELGCTLDEEIF